MPLRAVSRSVVQINSNTSSFFILPLLYPLFILCVPELVSLDRQLQNGVYSQNKMTDTNPKNCEEPSSKKQRVAPSTSKAGAAETLRRELKGGVNYDESGVVRKRTEVEEQVISNERAAERIVGTLPADDKTLPNVELFLPEMLKDAVFVGHLVTDLDSVAGAIGAAALYGGVPALASEINSETQWALDMWKVEKPRRLEEVLKDSPDVDICLVDHQQTSQMNPSIQADRVVGVIDHHALQSKTIVTNKPIYIDIRPWGSMSSM